MPDVDGDRSTWKRPLACCLECDELAQRISQAKMHLHLAQAWAELRQQQSHAQQQVTEAAAELENAFRQLQDHRSNAHRLSV